MNRPVGITILAILAILAAILGLIGGLAMAGIGSGMTAEGAAGSGAAFTALGVGVIIVALIQLLYGIGMWKLQKWAWILAVIGSILNLIVAGIALIGYEQYANVGGAVVSLIILWYLFRPHVKAAFGLA